MQRATAQGKRVLLIAGRDTCGNCQAMRETVCETPAVRALIDPYYVPWYCPIDDNTEWYPYAMGLMSFTLPLIAVVDPTRPTLYLERTTGYRPENTFLAFLETWVKPKPPVLNLNLTPGEGKSLSLQWTTDSNMRYQPQFSTDGGKNWTPLGDSIPGAQGPEIVIQVSPGTAALFRVMTSLNR